MAEQQELIELKNITNEMLVVGSFYKKPDLFIKYGASNSIVSKYDFTDVVVKFFYDNFVTYYKNFSETITGEKLNTFMASDDTRYSLYKKYGGYNTIESMMNLADVDDFQNYYDTLKKFTLIREYDGKGLIPYKLSKYINFDKLNASDIRKAISGLVNRIYTSVSGVKDSIDLSEDAQNTITEYLSTPQMGLPYPWKTLTEIFRGMRLGKLALNGFLSNEGKSRNLMLLMAHTALVQKEKFLLMSNEMSDEDLKSALITTVLNNQCFKELHKIDLVKPEEEIVLGLYRDDSDGEFIKRREDEDGNFLETEEEFISRVRENSEEFRKMLVVSRWIEENGGRNLLFVDVSSDYSDEKLEYEIRRHSIINGVKYFGYDTLKGYRTDDWQTLKQTATHLREVAKDVGAFIWGVFQLTDDSVFTDFFDLTSMNIANSKHMKHVSDYVMLGKRIPFEQYPDLEYIPIDEWGKSNPRKLDPTKKYFAMIIDKNRGGDKAVTPLFEYNLHTNVWNNIGSLRKIGV